MTPQDCMDCAELEDAVIRLKNALLPFLQPGVGLAFDTRRDGSVVIRCRQCSAWAGELIDGNFRHDSDCMYAKAKKALDDTQRIEERLYNMNAGLQYQLEQAIQKWADDNCESDKWPQEIVFGNRTVDNMAAAAAAVFDGILDAEKYGVREGLLKE